MFPFWDLAVAPVLEAAEAKRVVEVGALRGETTALMLDRLGPDSELHQRKSRTGPTRMVSA